MKKILFLIPNLGQGGAEKVLVNLVNHMDRQKFDITVMTLFAGGVNEQFLAPHIKYRSIFPKSIPGNSHIMKIFTPAFLHRCFIKEEYDVEISYLEGPAARIISGCRNSNTVLAGWIHCTMNTSKNVAASFRSMNEAETCYNAMDKLVFVSEGVREAFLDHCNYKGSTDVLYNTVESGKILEMSCKETDAIIKGQFGLVAVGTLKPVKGFDRLLRIVNRLKKENYPVHLYLLGTGPLQQEIKSFVEEQKLGANVTLLGYQTNPYQYVAKCDLFVCSSFAEGFSTAATEALIVGVPVITTEVSGMKEMLGENNEFGMVVDNNEEALYHGIKQLLDDPALLAHYRQRAMERGKDFSTEETVRAVEEMLDSLLDSKQV